MVPGHCRTQDPGRGPERLTLPLSAGAEALCLEAMAALGDPALRAEAVRSRALPCPVNQVLRLLDDPELDRAAAGLRDLRGPGLAAERRASRRALFQALGGRHPDALAALLGAFGAPRDAGPDNTFVVVDVYIWLIVITIGVNGRSDHPFADLGPAPCPG